MKKILCVLLSAAMLLSLCACGNSASEVSAADDGSGNDGDASNDRSITLVYAESDSPDTIVGMTAAKFKETVEALSDGSIIIEIRDSAKQEAESDVLDEILSGNDDIDIFCISAFALSNYGAQKATMLSLPFTFADRAHFWAFAESDLASEFLNEPQTLGLPVRGIFYGEEGFNHFLASAAVASVEDLVGMKLWAPNTPVMNGMIEAMGASAAMVPSDQLREALSSGLCNGAEQTVEKYKAGAFSEVAPYLILDGHTVSAVQAVITDNAWNRLTADQQAIILEAGKAVQAYNAEISGKMELEMLDQLKADGVTVVENVDRDAWKAACMSVIEANVQGQEDLYQKILDLAE